MNTAKEMREIAKNVYKNEPDVQFDKSIAMLDMMDECMAAIKFSAKSGMLKTRYVHDNCGNIEFRKKLTDLGFISIPSVVYRMCSDTGKKSDPQAVIDIYWY